jgi:hypothetical protein
MIVVHILEDGWPLCGFGGGALLPVDWPENHKPVTREEAESCNCARCRTKAGLPTTTDHWLERIDEVHIVVADNEEGEGVVSFKMGDAWMPLIACDVSRLKNITPLAKMCARETGQKLKLVKFTTRETVGEIEP